MFLQSINLEGNGIIDMTKEYYDKLISFLNDFLYNFDSNHDDAIEVAKRAVDKRYYPNKILKSQSKIVCGDCGKDIFYVPDFKFCPYCGRRLVDLD